MRHEEASPTRSQTLTGDRVTDAMRVRAFPAAVLLATMVVAAPLVVNDDAVRLAVIDKLGWIKRQKDVKDLSATRLREGDAVDADAFKALVRAAAALKVDLR